MSAGCWACNALRAFEREKVPAGWNRDSGLLLVGLASGFYRTEESAPRDLRFCKEHAAIYESTKGAPLPEGRRAS
jgi:hypothetical protein